MKSLRPYFEAQTVEELWTYHTSAMAEYGFDRLFYAYSCFQMSNRLSEPEDALILTNHSAAYVEAYVERGLFRSAPMMNWAAKNVGSTSWRQMAEAFANADGDPGAREVMALNKRMGILAGYTISFPMTIKHAAAGIGLTARKGLSQEDVDAIWAAKGEEIEIMNHTAHMCIKQLPATGQSRMLTPRQGEVLELVADGKSVQDIAILLDRKTATVDKHLRGARDSLGVETTAQAVRKASVLNQIFVLESEQHAS